MNIQYAVRVSDNKIMSGNLPTNKTYESWLKEFPEPDYKIISVDQDPISPWSDISLLKSDGLIVEPKTDEELIQDMSGFRKNKLYFSCKAFEDLNIDSNTKDELNKSEVLVENTTTVEDDLPKAKALGEWRMALWGLPSDEPQKDGSYYARKAYAESLGEPSYDFNNMPQCPHSYQEIHTERKSHLAGL